MPPAVEHKGDRTARRTQALGLSNEKEGACSTLKPDVSKDGEESSWELRMRYKVELHPDVVWFVRKRCTPEEQAAFYSQLEAIRLEPIKNSEATSDPSLSRYMLRFFRFGTNIAIFQFDPGRDRIRVRECRRIQQKPRRGQEAGQKEKPR